MTRNEQNLFAALRKLQILTRGLEVSKLGGAVSEAQEEAAKAIDYISDKRIDTESYAQMLARFLNEELGLTPGRVNKAMDVLREAIPQVMWDIPEEAA